MEVQTSAIVLSSLKYGDHGLIVKCYTERSGARSFILKNAYSGKNKKHTLFTALNQVKIIYEEKRNKGLIHLKDADPEIYYRSLHSQPLKVSILLFISEILSSVLNEEEPDFSLYHFLTESLKDFDSRHSDYSDFHLWFLLKLTHFLGFYPHLSGNFTYFDLANGISTNDVSSGSVIEGEEVELFRNLISLNFPSGETPKFNRQQRKKILELLMEYYALHISGFRHPKSLAVLHKLFE